MIAKCQLQIELPQTELPTFTGTHNKFQAYWEQFDAAVHSRTDFADVTKFIYLKSTLKGSSATLTEGFLLTNNICGTFITLHIPT